MGEHGTVLGNRGVVDATEPVGDDGGVVQPDGDGLAVAEIEAAVDLERVGEGVAVVEDRTSSAFSFVVGDHLGLDLDTAGDLVAQGPRREVVGSEESVLGHLAVTRIAIRGGPSWPTRRCRR